MPVGADPEHRASTIEGQIARVADIIAYVNHDIDDAVRAGILDPEDAADESASTCSAGRRPSASAAWSPTSSCETLEGGMTEIRMSDTILEATVGLRSFLFDAVYENEIATAEFKKAVGHPRRPLGEGPRAPGSVPRSRARSRPRASTPPRATFSPA